MIKYIFHWNLSITLEMRSSKSLMGRFGGGWNWKFGFQAGGSTIIISLLVMDLRIEFDTDD